MSIVAVVLKCQRIPTLATVPSDGCSQGRLYTARRRLSFRHPSISVIIELLGPFRISWRIVDDATLAHAAKSLFAESKANVC